jgi:hypothetical protein
LTGSRGRRIVIRWRSCIAKEEGTRKRRSSEKHYVLSTLHMGFVPLKVLEIIRSQIW